MLIFCNMDYLGDNGTILESTVPDMKSSDFSCQESAQAVVGHIPIKRISCICGERAHCFYVFHYHMENIHTTFEGLTPD